MKDREPYAVLPGHEPDEIDLELLEAGAVDEGADVARIQAAAEGPLADEAAELARFKEFWDSADRPALPAPPVETIKPANNRRWVVVALAAAVLLAVVGTQTVEDGVRTMGSLPVDLSVRRGGQQITPVAGHFQADDLLMLSLVAPRDGHLGIALLSQDGRTSVLWQSPPGSPITGGDRFSLDGAISLDNDGAGEWLIVALHDQPLSEEALSSELVGLLPAPSETARARGWWGYNVSRHP